MSETKLVRDYLRLFSEKNTRMLSDMLADDVELIDWDNAVTGKAAVLAFNQMVFDSVDTIDIYIDQLSDPAATMFAQIKVVIDGKSIDVVDVITIADGKIKKIQAYKK